MACFVATGLICEKLRESVLCTGHLHHFMLWDQHSKDNVCPHEEVVML